MSKRGTFARYLQKISVVLLVIAAAAAVYLLLFDASSNWVDWLVGGVLAVLTVYGVRSVFRPLDEQVVPVWRARDFGDVLVPFGLPMWLASWSEDRGSRLAWLGWGLLATSVVIQIAIWRLERSERAEPQAQVIR